MHIRFFALSLVAALFVLPSAASSLEKCKARINKKTGEIEVSAAKVVGTPLWGGLEFPANSFPDLMGCQKGDKLRKCLLGAPGSVEAKRTPASCSLNLLDDQVGCQIHIQGCVADAILSATISEVGMAGNWDLGRSYGAVELVRSQGVGTFEILFERTVNECFPSVTLFSPGHVTTCVHCGTTPRHLLVRTYDLNGAATDLRFYVSVHCP